jgi:L-lactate dehydrogenase complex protein LldF
LTITAQNFKANAGAALVDPQLQRALRHVRSNFIDKRARAAAALPEFDQLREQARAIKDHALAHLDLYLEAYEAKVQAAGGHVHFAETAADARDIVLDICRKAGARTVTKGKSMISEEIGLNEHLEANGVTRWRPTSANTSSSCAARRRATSSRRPSTSTRTRSRPTFRRVHTHLPATATFRADQPAGRGARPSCATASSPPMSA